MAEGEGLCLGTTYKGALRKRFAQERRWEKRGRDGIDQLRFLPSRY